MSESNKLHQTANEPENDASIQDKKSVRSSSYPATTILKAFDFACKINAQFSTIAEVTREEIALSFKLHGGSIIRDISSCVQYGLLNKNTAEGKYKLTTLFSDIFRPESEKDKKIALIKAFGSPKLYSELIAKLDNNVVPNEITNTLIKNHKIREEVSKAVADTFIESGKEVGVINENRFLKYALTLSTLEKTQYAVIEDLGNNNDGSTNGDFQFPQTIPAMQKTGGGEKKNINIPVHLTGNKIAIFSYPEDITENDIKIVEHQLAGVLLRIKFERDEKNKGVETPL